jgi:two-component system chemotaxis response regulator CheB
MIPITKVLIIDDSELARKALQYGLMKDPYIDVVGCAGDPYTARDQIVLLRPDVLTLDVDMPRMDGLEFLRKLMPQFPVPTIMVSALTERGAKITLEALEAGAVDFVTKPRAGAGFSLDAMLLELRTKVKIAATVNVSHWKNRKNELFKYAAQRKRRDSIHATIIAIGASTGGTEAIKQVLMGMPSDCPGIVVVQHMPEKFTRTFAQRLNTVCDMNVKEAEHGDRVETGLVLVAPGNRHMEVVRIGQGYEVRLKDGDNVSGHKPSVDVLMRSVAHCVADRGRGVLLTGMGADGAMGLLEMKRSGAKTFAQDEKSSVVFGMPKRALECGAVDRLLPLDRIAEYVMAS